MSSTALLRKRRSAVKFNNNFIFRLCEIFYRIGFSIVVYFKKRKQLTVPFFVISVGNLSVGGTGKSPLVIYLSKKISGNGVIITRGYGRLSGDKNLLISAYKSANLREVGDEAMMFLSKTSLPVAVGANRRRSVKLILDKKINVDYVILDDGYQNFQLKKDFEILLLDARAPFGNGHCLPAGPLREKDISRASVIVFTHSDEVSEAVHNNLKNLISNKHCFFGKHSVKDLVNYSGEAVVVKGIKFLAVAGIGSFSGFLYSLEKFGLIIAEKMEFADHFLYTRKDVVKVVDFMRQSGCDAIVTTEKDWERFKPFVGDYKNLFFLLRISFEFLSKKEEDAFFEILCNQISSTSAGSLRSGTVGCDVARPG
jgi:tetraacyldisaccharide 4'-kinase